MSKESACLFVTLEGLWNTKTVFPILSTVNYKPTHSFSLSLSTAPPKKKMWTSQFSFFIRRSEPANATEAFIEKFFLSDIKNKPFFIIIIIIRYPVWKTLVFYCIYCVQVNLLNKKIRIIDTIRLWLFQNEAFFTQGRINTETGDKLWRWVLK